MARRAFVLALMLTWGGVLARSPAGAEDAADPPRLLWEKDADRVVAAAAQGPDALASAVRSPAVDPWILADTLAARGAWDAATAVVAAWKGPRFEHLAAYVEGQRKTPLDAAVRAARDRVALAAKGGGNLARALEEADAAPRTLDGVPGAWLLHLRGRILASMGRDADAVEAFRRSADVAEAVGWKEQMHASLQQGGILAFRGHQEEVALALVRRQVVVAEQIATPEDLAGSVINVGSLCAKLHRWDEAVLWLRRGLDLTMPSVGGDAAKLRNYRLNDLVALGQLHYHRGEYAHAVGILAEAPALAASLGRAVERGIVLLFLGKARLALELAEEGATAFAQAAEVFEATGDVARRREALRGEAACLLDRGDAEGALAVHDRLAALAGSPPPSAGERVSDLGERALALQEAGRHDEADRAYAEALAVATAADDHDSASWVRLNRATLLCEQGRYAQARPLLEAALAAAERAGAAYDERHALRWLAEVALAEGDPARARAHVDRGLARTTTLIANLSDAEAARARGALAALLHVGLQAALAQGDAAGGLRYVETGRGLGFLEMLGARGTDAAAAVPPGLREAADAANRRVVEARDHVATATTATDLAARRAARRELDEALAAFEVARGAIERESKLAADVAYPQAADAESIARALPSDAALVAYARVRSDLYALVLRANGTVRPVRLGDLSSLEPLVDAFLAAAPDPTSTVDPAPLRDRLVTPLALGADVRRVVVVPAGSLHLLPFAALMPDRDVSYAPSGTVLLRLGRPTAASDAGVLALGDPDYAGASARTSAAARPGAGLTRLPATAVEVRRVAAAPGDVVLVGPEATEEGLRRALGSRPRWHAVHVACHGLLDADRPALSALALTPAGLDDGYLTALEVGALRIDADLVVLSACETSKGRLEACEGVVGLARSFMLAGTPRVVCSLWKVDDEATQALMGKLYELWRPPPQSGRTPASPATALRQAQAYVRAQPRWQHPYYWAAWVLWGVAD